MHITLVSSQSSQLLREALGKGVLDSGCSKTCAGNDWLTQFVSTLNEKLRAMISEKVSNSVFRFGDGAETKSMKLVSVPIYFMDMLFIMDIEIVKYNIPLLISNAAMRQMGMIIDFEQNTVSVQGLSMNLIFTNSGHPCIPVSNYHVGLERV